MVRDLSSLELAIAKSDALSAKERLKTARGADDQVKANSVLLNDRMVGMFGVVVVIATLMLISMDKIVFAALVFGIPAVGWGMFKIARLKKVRSVRKEQLREFDEVRLDE